MAGKQADNCNDDPSNATKIMVGDMLVEVGDVRVTGMTLHDALGEFVCVGVLGS